MRLARDSCVYGNGTYFAEASPTALAYSNARRSASPFNPITFVQHGLLGSQPQAAPAPGPGSSFSGMPAPDPGHLKMVLAKVLLGRQAPGKSGMRKPPTGCDSVTGVVGHEATHVVFDNDQAYPLYIVTLRP